MIHDIYDDDVLMAPSDSNFKSWGVYKADCTTYYYTNWRVSNWSRITGYSPLELFLRHLVVKCQKDLLSATWRKI